MFKHILLPVDGSELSLRAVDTGIALAAALGARVHALHVLPPFPAVTYFAAIAQANETMYVERAVASAERVLAEVQRRADAAGVPCTTSHEIDSRPYTAIAAAVSKYHCDLIVMATHGWHGIEKLLLGSVTQKALLLADVPVLVCR
ncbi:universal stress protein [Rhodanobacter umsongensis]|uniref:Universal stress protein n=1 Tax=Rhodanobacter umsongensis TaxID=633153 RepID=A0ABW0JM84_9GAMM